MSLCFEPFSQFQLGHNQQVVHQMKQETKSRETELFCPQICDGVVQSSQGKG
jgi:hypothetical protein